MSLKCSLKILRPPLCPILFHYNLGSPFCILYHTVYYKVFPSCDEIGCNPQLIWTTKLEIEQKRPLIALLIQCGLIFRFVALK